MYAAKVLSSAKSQVEPFLPYQPSTEMKSLLVDLYRDASNTIEQEYGVYYRYVVRNNHGAVHLELATDTEPPY